MKKVNMITAMCCLLLIQTASAAEVQIKRFKAGDVIYAEDVNANFQALADTIKQLEKRIADLEQRNAALQAEIAGLKKQSVTPVSTSTPQPASQTSTKTPKYRLRSTPKTVSSDAEAQQAFGLAQNRRRLQYIENDFERKGDVVLDHATGLMWQQSGSPKVLTYQEAQRYLQQLNQAHFARYNDWRFPTVEELLSLLEMEQSNGLYLDPIFDSTQRWCWSMDLRSEGQVWLVHFVNNYVDWYYIHYASYVRAVRTGQ